MHDVTIDKVVIGVEAVGELAAYVGARGWSKPFVVMDANTKEALGWRVVDELSRTKLRSYEFSERQGLRADEPAVARLEASLGEGEADVLIAVGSGVLTDLTRYVANRSGRFFVSVPTAASMDGYASSVAAMEFGGMKTTFPAVAPAAIFADPVTVAAAPPDMTRSGLGDLLGKASARVDWPMGSMASRTVPRSNGGSPSPLSTLRRRSTTSCASRRRPLRSSCTGSSNRGLPWP